MNRAGKNIMRSCSLLVLLFSISTNNLNAQLGETTIPKLKNPVDVDYLEQNLPSYHPRLGLTPQLISNIKRNITVDPLVKNLFQAFKLNAANIMQLPLLERELEGRRLLAISREMLYRMNILATVYAVEEDKQILERINQEVIQVCNFIDWNPSHFLDVAEMSLAVAIGIDWTGEDLPPGTIRLAKDALMEKGIRPSYMNIPGSPDWVKGTHNWNQVCHAGMTAAAIATAEDEPALAAQTISRALEGMPYALKAYMPDGVYPEGPSYWSYGTSFTLMTEAMLQSAFDTDFGIADFPGLLESANFWLMSIGTEGRFYNFSDCGNYRDKNGDFNLAWFASKTNDGLYYEQERFMIKPSQIGKLEREAGFGLIWLSQFNQQINSDLPSTWQGDGKNPVVYFRSERDDPRQYYFAGKGGRGSVNHGNMDAGSFVFELDSIRWSIDLGNQSYNDLERAGFNLWSKCQTCDRWKLLTKNNFGHSTLTINDQLHFVDGMAEITNFDEATPSATIDLSPAFAELLDAAFRTFIIQEDQSLLVVDSVITNTNTSSITWQMMTEADIAITKGGAVLTQEGKTLKVENLSHSDISFTFLELYPPPHRLDIKMEGLKRLELNIPVDQLDQDEAVIKIKLSKY